MTSGSIFSNLKLLVFAHASACDGTGESMSKQRKHKLNQLLHNVVFVSRSVGRKLHSPRSIAEVQRQLARGCKSWCVAIDGVHHVRPHLAGAAGLATAVTAAAATRLQLSPASLQASANGGENGEANASLSTVGDAVDASGLGLDIS
jgi:hypothetical protein